MAKLGVVASTDPFWIPMPPELEPIQSYGLGKERTAAMHPISPPAIPQRSWIPDGAF
jgi:hypothetical protein